MLPSWQMATLTRGITDELAGSVLVNEGLTRSAAADHNRFHRMTDSVILGGSA